MSYLEAGTSGPSEGCILPCGHLHLGSRFSVLEPLWELVPMRVGVDGFFCLGVGGVWKQMMEGGALELG